MLGFGPLAATPLAALRDAVSYTVSIDPGSYSVAGSAMTPKRARITALAAGAYSLAGSALATRSARRIFLYNPELLSNGGFDTDTLWSHAHASLTIAGGQGVFTATPSTLGFSQNSVLTAGKTYIITYDVVEYTSGAVSLRTTGGNNQDNQRTAVGSYSETITAVSNGTITLQARGTATLKIDNVSVREVTAYVLTGTAASLLK